MAEEYQPAGFCRWRRTERRTRAAKEIDMEIRLRERQRARRYADREARDRRTSVISLKGDDSRR